MGADSGFESGNLLKACETASNSGPDMVSRELLPVVRAKKSFHPLVPVSTFFCSAMSKTLSADIGVLASYPVLNVRIDSSEPFSPTSANPGWASFRSSME